LDEDTGNEVDELPQDLDADVHEGSDNSVILDNPDVAATSDEFTEGTKMEGCSSRAVDENNSIQSTDNDFNLSLNKKPRLSSSSSSSSSACSLPNTDNSLITNNEAEQLLIGKNPSDAVAAFEDEENQELEEDHMVQCNECFRWVHALCEVYATHIYKYIHIHI
jgi:hypothetical protein